MQNAIAKGHHRKHLGLTVKKVVERQTQRARQKRTDGGLEMRRQRQPMKNMRQAVKASGVEHRQHNHEQRQERVTDQVKGLIEGQQVEQRLLQVKQRRPTEGETKRAVGDDAGQPRGNNHLGLEIRRTVKDLGGEQRPRQRRPENGRDAGAHACRHEDSPFRGT